MLRLEEEPAPAAVTTTPPDILTDTIYTVEQKMKENVAPAIPAFPAQLSGANPQAVPVTGMSSTENDTSADMLPAASRGVQIQHQWPLDVNIHGIIKPRSGLSEFLRLQECCPLVGEMYEPNQWRGSVIFSETLGELNVGYENVFATRRCSFSMCIDQCGFFRADGDHYTISRTLDKVVEVLENVHNRSFHSTFVCTNTLF